MSPTPRGSRDLLVPLGSNSSSTTVVPWWDMNTSEEIRPTVEDQAVRFLSVHKEGMAVLLLGFFFEISMIFRKKMSVESYTEIVSY